METHFVGERDVERAKLVKNKKDINKNNHEANIDVSFGVVSISSSKFAKYGKTREIPEDDESSKIVKNIIEKDFRFNGYILAPDNSQEIIKAILELSDKVDIIVTVGGTGITPKDVTIEALKPLIKKEIIGFGEIFRLESYKEVGFSAILSRAFAGVLDNRCVVFCLPGSKNAAKTGSKIILLIAKHVVSHAKGLK